MKRIKTMIVTLLFLLACLLAGCGKTAPDAPMMTSPSVSPEPSESGPPFIIHQTPTHGGDTPELIFDDEYFVYYLSSTYSEQIFIEFPDGRMVPLRQALEKGIVSIDELMENGFRAKPYPVNPEFFAKGQGNFLSDRHDLDYLLIVNGHEYQVELYFLFFISHGTSDDGKDHLYFEYDALIEYFQSSEAGDMAETLRQYDGELVRIGDEMYIPNDIMEELGIGNITWDHTRTVIEEGTGLRFLLSIRPKGMHSGYE
ncbi:MAG: hypothetical protein ACOX88_02210 [Christensenellales bacterium]|jgi:hypothetical protein